MSSAVLHEEATAAKQGLFKIGTLGCLIAGMSVFSGTAVQAVGSINDCEMTPEELTVFEDDPRQYVDISYYPDDGLEAWVEVISESLPPVGDFSTVTDGNYSLPEWFMFSGQTVRVDVYATDGNGVKSGSVLCSISVFYSLGGGEAGRRIDLDHYLERAALESELPDTL